MPAHILAVHGYAVGWNPERKIPELSPLARVVCEEVSWACRKDENIVFLGGIDAPSLAETGTTIAEIMRDELIVLFGVPDGGFTLPGDIIDLAKVRPPCDTGEEGKLLFLHLLRNPGATVRVVAVSQWMPRIRRIYRKLGIEVSEFIEVRTVVPPGLRFNLGIANLLSVIDPLGEGIVTGMPLASNRDKRGLAWPGPLDLPALIP